MASPLNQPSVRRKLIYFGLMLALFALNTFLWRGVASPLTGGVAPPWTVSSQAEALELRETSVGEPELVGSTLRLGLTGSRGLAVTVLWNAAIEKQKKNEWNELELLVKSLTKLQPHFLTPWLFQSWNLAYNVSVESDRVRDKYFYITRGIELLAEGERLNKDNPDMRFWLGFYYINKFGVSDEANTLRSLFQMSCIPPAARDPQKLRTKSDSPDAKDEFQTFVEANPQLVRRLREQLKYDTRDAIIDFLADNRKLPSRYVILDADKQSVFGPKEGDLLPPDQQFPSLPSREPVTSPAEFTSKAGLLTDSFDNYMAARSWFAYSIDPLPEPEFMTAVRDKRDRLAGQPGKKLPRSPAEVIFRQYPARAQSFVGERLQKEGFFDAEGWLVDQGRKEARRRFFPVGKEVRAGTGVAWCEEAWRMAYEKWREHGVSTGMYLEPVEITRLEELAKKFRDRYHVAPHDPVPNARLETVEESLRDSFIAHRKLVYRDQNLTMTNFPHHFNRAFTEMDKSAIMARKRIFEAQRAYKSADPSEAIRKYEEGFALWKEVFQRYPNFREDNSIQEDIYELQVKYVQLLAEHRGATLRPALVAADVLAQASAGGFPGQPGLGVLYEVVRDPKALPLPILGPFDSTDAKGVPWIPPEVMTTVRMKLGLDTPPAPSPAPPTAGTPTSETPR
ncbi:MAG: hypothetical protein U0746_11705 [Gemmataceae bacterium]